MKLKVGDSFAEPKLIAVNGPEFAIPDKDAWTHIQFLRFAGCPICNLHVRQFTKRSEELAKAEIREVILFHSSKKAVEPYVKGLPFTAIADPQKVLYSKYGVESSPKAKASLKAIRDGLIGMFMFRPTTLAEGGTNGLPADILVAPDGKIKAVKYGMHAADQWSVDDVIQFRNA